ncbi:LysR family transcriptional regulator [Devosia sp. A8/3-2]|nr:LysR family transcriptional regulator [Devosia sp. A8/3-2]
MDFSWDDLRLFLDVARLGGLSAATATTGLSAATLGRRITALERQLGEPLFARSQTGYRLTPAGEALLARAEEVETAMLSLKRWKEGAIGERVVRVSAGAWTSAFLARHIGTLWSVEDRFGLELVTANEKVDIGRRNADLGILQPAPLRAMAGRAADRQGGLWPLFGPQLGQWHCRRIFRRHCRRWRPDPIGPLDAGAPW